MSCYRQELDNSKQFEQFANALAARSVPSCKLCFKLIRKYRHGYQLYVTHNKSHCHTHCRSSSTVVQDCTVNTQSVPSRHSWCSNCKYILKTHCVLLSASSAAFKPQSESHKKQRCSSGGFQCMSWTPSSRESCKHSLASSKWLSRTVRLSGSISQHL